MFYYSCCPNISFRSFTVIISIIDFIIFVITLLIGGISSGIPGTPAQFLEVNPTVLVTFGDRYPYYMEDNY